MASGGGVNSAGSGLWRGVAVDAALALFVLVTVATAISAQLETDARAVSPVTYLFAIGLAVPMLGRRRWPVAMLLVTVAVLLAYYVVGYPAIGLAVPLSAALYSTAERGRVRWALAVAVGLLVSTTTLRTLQGQDAALLLAYEAPLSATLMAAVILLGDTVRTRRLLEEESRRRAAQEAAEREREAKRRVADERLRIARDLHDVIGHTVAVISVQADVAMEALAEQEIEPASSALAAIRSASREAMGELRGAVGMLREDGAAAPRRPARGTADLERLAEQARAGGLDVDLAVDPDLPVLPVAVAGAAHRIVQESLTNVLRHSGARHVRVALTHEEGYLVVTVRDDGRGAAVDPADAAPVDPAPAGPGLADPAPADPAPADPASGGHDMADQAPAGHGLAGMRERAALLGGWLESGPDPAGGYAVVAHVPVGADAGRAAP